MTYISRYQHRKQTIATSKFESTRSIERYDYFYDVAYEGVSKNAFPLISFSVGQILMRKTGKHPNGHRHFNRDESRQIPPAQFSSKSQTVRYSGIRLDGKQGQGVLYMGTLAGVLREIAHYESTGSGLTSPGRIDTKKSHIAQMKNVYTGAMLEEKDYPYHIYTLAQPMTFANIRLPALLTYLNRVRPMSGDDLRVLSVYDGADYSAARGIADAVYDAGAMKGIRGVCADSSRMDSDLHLNFTHHGDPTGGLIIAIFGQPGTTVHELLPVKSFPDFKSMAEHVLP